MADLATFSRAKDWAIATLIALVFTLAGMGYSSVEKRLSAVEAGGEAGQLAIEALRATQARQDGIQDARWTDLMRRLDRIEEKLR